MKTIAFVLFALVALSANASTLLLDTFESAAPGSIDGQNSWILESGTANVQTAQAHNGTNALNISNGSVSHALTSERSSIWTRFQVFVTGAPTANPAVTAGNTSVAFFVNTNLTLTVYSNTTPVVLSTPVATNVWTRFDVYCDYEDLTWDLSMNGTNVSAGLPLYSSNQQAEEVLIANNSSDSVYVDDIEILDEEMVALAPDGDNDGMPDWWEQKYGSSITGLLPSQASANPGYNYLQAYIAGLSPDAPDLFATTQTGPYGLTWSPKAGRIYDVLWSPNLLSGFTPIATNLPATQAEFVDRSSNTNLPAGFYKLRVRVDN